MLASWLELSYGNLEASSRSPLLTFAYAKNLSGAASGKKSTCQCRRHKRQGFNPWVGNVPRRRARQPTPVFLPGKSHGQRSLAGYRPWGHRQSDRTQCEGHTHRTYFWVPGPAAYMCLLDHSGRDPTQVCSAGPALHKPSFWRQTDT